MAKHDPLEAAKKGNQISTLAAKPLPAVDASPPKVDPVPPPQEPPAVDPVLPPPQIVVARALRAYKAKKALVLSWQGMTIQVKEGDVIAEETHGAALMNQLATIDSFEALQRN